MRIMEKQNTEPISTGIILWSSRNGHTETYFMRQYGQLILSGSLESRFCPAHWTALQEKVQKVSLLKV